MVYSTPFREARRVTSASSEIQPLMNPVEYVVEKKGVGKVTYFIACRDNGDGWIAGFFPAYMSPDPDEDSEAEMFDLANPDHTVTAATREEAAEALRVWIEANYTVVERRESRSTGD